MYSDDRTHNPSINLDTTVLNPGASTTHLSGVSFYDNVTPMSWSVVATGHYLWDGGYYTGTHVSADLPVAFLSAQDPVVLDFSMFGGGTAPAAYYQMSRTTGGATFGLANPPQKTDAAILALPTQGIVSPTAVSPVYGTAQVLVIANTPFFGPVTNATSTAYLYNSCPQTVATHSTKATEPFDDELYRYALSSNFDLRTKPIVPVGGDHRSGATVITGADNDLQVIGGLVTYPSTDYSGRLYSPTGPNYAGVYAGDSVDYLRRYVRAFNTEMPRNTGKIRLQGVSYNDILSAIGNPSTETAGHTGRVLVQIKVPGITGWLDVGRDYGLPDLNVAVDFRGCKTGISPNDPTANDFEVSYCTGTAYTADNGFGDFILWVRVTMMKPLTMPTKAVTLITWVAP